MSGFRWTWNVQMSRSWIMDKESMEIGRKEDLSCCFSLSLSVASKKTKDSGWCEPAPDQCAEDH